MHVCFKSSPDRYQNLYLNNCSNDYTGSIVRSYLANQDEFICHHSIMQNLHY